MMWEIWVNTVGSPAPLSNFVVGGGRGLHNFFLKTKDKPEKRELM